MDKFKLSPVKIGDVTVPHGLFLAPMAGMTDGAFRYIARKAGAEYCVSEMISSLAMCYGDKKTAQLAKIQEFDSPIALQIFGHDPESMAKASLMLVGGDFSGADYAHLPAAIDINMGCPVRKIVSSGDGSALMRDPDRAAEIVSSVKRAVYDLGIPVTVKIRSGWDGEHINAPEFAAKMANAGADAIYIHARTREQMYVPGIDLSVIARVRDSVPATVPVIGNGDIRSVHEAREMICYSGCDGIMIGRAALGDPWIFSEIKSASDGTEYVKADFDMKINTALEMLRLMIAEYGEAVAVREARARAAYFIRDMRGAASIRFKLNHAVTYTEFENILLDAAKNAANE